MLSDPTKVPGLRSKPGTFCEKRDGTMQEGGDQSRALKPQKYERWPKQAGCVTPGRPSRRLWINGCHQTPIRVRRNLTRPDGNATFGRTPRILALFAVSRPLPYPDLAYSSRPTTNLPKRRLARYRS